MRPLVQIGKVVKTKGLRGQVKAIPYGGQDSSLAVARKVVAQKPGGEARELTVAKVYSDKGGMRLQFEEVDSLEEAQSLVGAILLMERSNLTALEPGEYYLFDLVGLKVQDGQGRFLGIVNGVLPTGNYDLLVVKRDEQEWLLPALEEMVDRVDLEQGILVVSPPEGLTELA